MQATNSVHDMHVVNTDAVSHQTRTPEKSWRPLRWRIRRLTYTLVLTSVDTSLPFSTQWTAFWGVEAEATLKRIASRLTKKM